MKLTPRVGFRDTISGEQVCYYKDKYGMEWMAAHPYYPLKFRVKTSND